ncbi:MAG TPA: hypothetical protein DCG28_04440 [Lachnospiraceae bacterium]|nr:hypothetical protein [Lachnospiraceae bacterium]
MRKSLLKTVVATAIVGAVMAVSSFVAMAATKEYYYVADQVNTEDFFQVAGDSLGGGAFTTDKLEINGVEYTPTGAKKFNASGSVKFTTSGTATVQVVYGKRADKTGTVKLGLDGNEILSTTDNRATQTVSNVASGLHTLARTSGEGALYAVYVKDEISDSAKEYTVSGSTNLANATFTVGDESVTTDKNGNWSISKTAETSPFTVGDTLAVSMDGYSAEPSSVTLGAGSDEYNFTASTITFTELTLSELTKGKFYSSTEIAAGKPNFDLSSVNWNDKNNCRVNTGSVIKFISPVDGFMVLNGKSGSSSKDVNIVIGNNTANVPNNQVNNFVLAVNAGENTLEINEGAGGSTSLYINSIVVAGNIADTLQLSPKNVDYYCVDATSTYIIHPVSDKEMEYAKLAMADSDGVAIDATSTDSAYTSVVFSDQSEVTASSCGATYIYAIQVTGTDGSAPTQKYKWVEVGGAE